MTIDLSSESWKCLGQSVPGLVNVYKKRWTDPPCYQWENPRTKWAIFNSKLLKYQRVYSANMVMLVLNYGELISRHPKN